MPADLLNYGRMMHQALRRVVADALGQAAEHGLPGEHHFYIAIDTTHPGIDMPDWLRERYPREITVVLQHEFSDLAVTPDRFSVRLSFSNRPATLVVPLDAIKTFVDPSVEFGLRFDSHDEDDEAEAAPDPEEPDEEAADRGPGEVVSLDSFRKT